MVGCHSGALCALRDPFSFFRRCPVHYTRRNGFSYAVLEFWARPNEYTARVDWAAEAGVVETRSRATAVGGCRLSAGA